MMHIRTYFLKRMIMHIVEGLKGELPDLTPNRTRGGVGKGWTYVCYQLWATDIVSHVRDTSSMLLL